MELGGPGVEAKLRSRLPRALTSCATEADVVQLLYAELHPIFGYDPINLQVLEHEGWYHSRALDHGLLQDVRRRQLSVSNFAANFADPRSEVRYESPEMVMEQGRGPGSTTRPQVMIWVPVWNRGSLVGAVIYQLADRREITPDELAFLEDLHAHLGVVMSNASLNELTRNQAVSLWALNAIARALSGTRDERAVVTALRETLGGLLPIETLEVVIPDESRPERLRILQGRLGHEVRASVRPRSRVVPEIRQVLDGESGLLGLASDAESRAWVPVKEGGRAIAVLSMRTVQSQAYEQSTLLFLEQVADQAGLALRNAWSYAALQMEREHLQLANVALEDQRRRLQVVEAVGRRLGSSLDRRSIMRALRQELARHLEFDLFSLATVEPGPEGALAEAYVYDSGEERQLEPVPLAAAGPAREAYETGRPVLIGSSPWADAFEAGQQEEGGRRTTRGAVMFVTRSGKRSQVATRSIVWVPVRQGDQVKALLSLQSYQADAFTEWEVQVLQDVAAHVSLALATAQHFQVAKAERRRLEALHLLETGVAVASDERDVAEALFRAIRGSVESSGLLLLYVDPRHQLRGFATAGGGPIQTLHPKPVERTSYFKRLMEEGATISEKPPADFGRGHPGVGWKTGDDRWPAQVVWVPLLEGDRVVGAVSAQRFQNQPFAAEEVELLESAAPAVAIALRTVRLHRANELALRHSLRIQELGALAGHDLSSVVTSIAEQAGSMLGTAGAACWAFSEDGQVAASGAAGADAAARVLRWSGGELWERWKGTPAGVLRGTRRRLAWTLVPLHYGERLVGALGFVHGTPDQLEAPADFVRHAGVAIENARLVAETWGRIRTLEAVAAFADLDLRRSEPARLEMGRLVERALADSRGSLWLLEGSEMVRASREGPEKLALPSRVRLGTLYSSGRRQVAAMLSLRAEQVLAIPIVADGMPAGLLTADAAGPAPAETRRLMAVLASQAGVVLARIQTVASLDRQAQEMTAILRHSPVGVVLEDGEGRIVYANPVVERIYGVPSPELVGHSAEELLARAGGTLVVDAESRPGGPTEVRLQGRGDRVIQLRQVPIPGSADRPAGLLTLHEDVTEERAVLDAKDLMLRAIGHEVRSPAAAMRNTVAALLQWDQAMEPAERRARLEDAYDQSERLLNLVEAQLIISKLEAGGFQAHPVTVSLGDVADQVRKVLSNRYGGRVEAVDFQFPSRLPQAWCDSTHLEQALTNLIGNALEHSWATTIVVSARRDGAWLEVTVEDNGRGLAQERVEALFSRSLAGQHRNRGGLGLGLYLCRLIVERSFGGRVWLERTGSEGSSFRFTVPAADVARHRRQAGSMPKQLH